MVSPHLTATQHALGEALLNALDEAHPQPDALPGLWAQLEPQLTAELVQWLSQKRVVQKAMHLNPPWVTGAQALVAQGATVHGYPNVVMERSLEYQAPEIYQRALETHKIDPSDTDFLEGLIQIALKHGHDAIALDLLGRAE